jgi:hypothetical protein
MDNNRTLDYEIIDNQINIQIVSFRYIAVITTNLLIQVFIIEIVVNACER